MPYYRRVGEVPRKRHVQFHQPDGSLYAEELMGEEGFSAESALLYHRRSPTQITAAEELPSEPAGLRPNSPLLPRHLRTHELKTGGDLVGGRHLLLGNDDLRLSYVAAQDSSPLYRDATGDELVYVEAGDAVLESTFGRLPAYEGDYVVVPANTTHRWVVRPGATVRALVVEARGHLHPPARYLSKRGQFLEHAPYCERDLRGPDEPYVVDRDGPVDVLVRRRSPHGATLTRHTYAHHPFDVVGWDGCLYPYAFNVNDFEPVVGRLHQPPPVHQTFAGRGFVVCSFVPRPFDFHPQAVPVPYNHANVDSDEVLFYAGGDFMSRAGSGVGPGSISLHPSGFVHGPQPGSVQRAIGRPGTDELAVMIDTFAPLELAPAARQVEADDYPWTWARNAVPKGETR
ncbi:MAG TPA: homogentisate 1,2-dioxygenase [Frankiaceae bacterium]|nr:homogentisate 1,2-dioxygenase [Frankiaceae bacterium]